VWYFSGLAYDDLGQFQKPWWLLEQAKCDKGNINSQAYVDLARVYEKMGRSDWRWLNIRLF